MTVTVASFRAAFPEFGGPSTQTYPDPEVQFWLDLSVNLLDAGRWGALFDHGQQLFIAHNLALSFTSKAGVATGQPPGQITGAVTSASVDKVSYSRDTSSMMNDKAGHWNLTTYGLRYRQLVKMIGAGPIHIGADNMTNVSAWQGPQYF
jgi:hypothetical protein